MAFCDWLTIYQDHYGVELPRINNGCVWSIDADGQIEWTTERNFEHVGSYDTKIRIRCNGSRVKLDGNIGRLDRADNVFGHSVYQCIALANALLARFDLPPFTVPQFNASSGELAGGAIITRVDLTENYATGSHRKALKLVNYLAGHDAGRRATVKQYGDNGVVWNEGSKYQSSKLYIKAESLGPHASDQLAEWVRQQGIARHEITLKSRFLKQKKLQHINDWQAYENGKLTDMDNIIYGRFTEVLTRGTAIDTQIEEIPKTLGHVALAWRAGKNVFGDENYSIRTRQRYRKQLLKYGIDIKQPANMSRIATRIDVIQMKAVEAPSWYWHKAA